MLISVLTLFPEMFTGPLSQSIVARAQAQKKVIFKFINIRDFAVDKYKAVDDHPYGGGAGMVLRVDVVDRAIKSTLGSDKKRKIILLDPQGKTYNQAKAQQLTKFNHLILVCGHYEGVDARIRKLVDEEISIGDYVLTGGEIPAMVIIDSIVRLLPGVLAKPQSSRDESFSQGFLQYPQYTRPNVYRKMPVPPVLLSGNHAKIAIWRKHQSVKKTLQQRPDLQRKGVGSRQTS